ncbi:2OG-Fe(II) oxygenase [Parerythrobacter aurantius]|uniref:2OG-Fe(II) oxygenase n=1 Tax=Parerythrobacter aurantius TaxID=3127706 RepID=UPI0032554727
MNAAGLPRHAVIDDFLEQAVAQQLLDHALGGQGLFEPAVVTDRGSYLVSAEHRQACSTSHLGPAGSRFIAAVEAHFEPLCAALGLAPFPIMAWDVEMAAHRDGGFFREHIDTMTAENRETQPGDRIISLVCYLHRPRAAFTGGDLVLKPFVGNAGEARIAPRHNRLVAFPSFARHEVEPIRVPGDAWEDARFSINCWLLRAR